MMTMIPAVNLPSKRPLIEPNKPCFFARRSGFNVLNQNPIASPKVIGGFSALVQPLEEQGPVRTGHPDLQQLQWSVPKTRPGSGRRSRSKIFTVHKRLLHPVTQASLTCFDAPAATDRWHCAAPSQVRDLADGLTEYQVDVLSHIDRNDDNRCLKLLQCRGEQVPQRTFSECLTHKRAGVNYRDTYLARARVCLVVSKHLSHTTSRQGLLIPRRVFSCVIVFKMMPMPQGQKSNARGSYQAHLSSACADRVK